jgi:hypothetical protein
MCAIAASSYTCLSFRGFILTRKNRGLLFGTAVSLLALGLVGGAAFAQSPAPVGTPVASTGTQMAAAVPLFRDPVHDGAADPVVVWNRAKKVWWMLYTNRRADLASGGGVEWVHGTHIGIAQSADGGAHWKYVSEADIQFGKPDYTFWAPEVIYTGGKYHMFLTVVDGIFTDWNRPRHILHLTSADLLHWKPQADVNLPSDKTIDACVFRLKDGTWRLWYNNERAGSRIWYSDSKDLVHWTEKGVAIKNNSGEGPVVFEWKGSYWMLEDTAPGLSAFRSSDLENWTRQPDKLLLTPGTQPSDRMEGKHPDVVVDGAGKAWLFYFTQQGGPDAEGHDRGWARRSVLHVSELHEADGLLTVDRNAPAYIHMLPPPVNKKSDMAGAWADAGTNVPPVEAATTPQPIRVSSGSMAGLLISRVAPIFPVPPSGARGTIILHAVISKDGDVKTLEVVSGQAWLQGPVVDAVKQWKYRPYQVDGQPIEVQTTITMNFLLGKPG